jgi:hypothetical protein
MGIYIYKFHKNPEQVWHSIAIKICQDLQNIFNIKIPIDNYTPDILPPLPAVVILIGVYDDDIPIHRNKFKTILYQTEQSFSRVFNQDSKFYHEWIPILDQIWDFSPKNIDKIGNKGYFMPLSGDYITSSHVFNIVRPQDIVFVGLLNDRRKYIIDKIREAGLSISVYGGYNVWGDLLNKILDNAKIVINIHYYENASLETERITQALSHGCCVVSETSFDTKLDQLFDGSIMLSKIGDIDGLINNLKYLLQHPEKMENLRQNSPKMNQKITDMRMSQIKNCALLTSINKT